MNQITLIGHVGKQPEIKNFENGKLANFTLAVTKRWNSDGQRKEVTIWFNIQASGKTADVAEKYINKGDKLAVIGEMRSREYTDKEGIKRTAWEVYVNQLEMLGGKNGEKHEEVAEIFPDKSKQKASVDAQAPASLTPDDDLPF